MKKWLDAYQVGGPANPPIIVHDPNDPRLIANRDSVEAYNDSRDADEYWSRQYVNRSTGHPTNILDATGRSIGEGSGIEYMHPNLRPESYNWYNTWREDRSSQTPTTVPMYRKPERIIKYIKEDLINKLVQGHPNQLPTPIQSQQHNLQQIDPYSDANYQYDYNGRFVPDVYHQRMGYPNKYDAVKMKDGGWLDVYQTGGPTGSAGNTYNDSLNLYNGSQEVLRNINEQYPTGMKKVPYSDHEYPQARQVNPNIMPDHLLKGHGQVFGIYKQPAQPQSGSYRVFGGVPEEYRGASFPTRAAADSFVATQPTTVLQQGGKIARNPFEQYIGLNDQNYDTMEFPGTGNRTFRGLDDRTPVQITDSTGKQKVLKGPSDTSIFRGHVSEKRVPGYGTQWGEMRNGGWLAKFDIPSYGQYQNGGQAQKGKIEWLHEYEKHWS